MVMVTFLVPFTPARLVPLFIIAPRLRRLRLITVLSRFDLTLLLRRVRSPPEVRSPPGVEARRGSHLNYYLDFARVGG
jgi:hypothetical protein